MTARNFWEKLYVAWATTLPTPPRNPQPPGPAEKEFFDQAGRLVAGAGGSAEVGQPGGLVAWSWKLHRLAAWSWKLHRLGAAALPLDVLSCLLIRQHACTTIDRSFASAVRCALMETNDANIYEHLRTFVDNTNIYCYTWFIN